MTPPPYRERLSTGIVHFGPGAFHRAHQADYLDRLLAEDPRWGIAAVSLRTADTVEALKSQDGIYTLAILDSEMSFRAIGAHSRFLGPIESTSVRAQLLDPAVRIITSTVTEKGYCLSGDGLLDFDRPDIVHDLANPAQPRTRVGVWHEATNTGRGGGSITSGAGAAPDRDGAPVRRNRAQAAQWRSHRFCSET